MSKKLKPNLFLNSVYELETDILKKENIDGIIIDIDNTLVAWEAKHADDNVKRLVQRLLENGFKVCILSNNSKKRVELFNQELNLPAIHKASKPGRAAFIKAMDMMDTHDRNTAVIGDQLFTDVYGGNKLGLFTILVSPISKKEFIGTKFVRFVERMVLRDIPDDIIR